MGEDALIPTGKIVGTHGIKSHLKVISCGDSVDLFAPGKERLPTFSILLNGLNSLTKQRFLARCILATPQNRPSLTEIQHCKEC